MSELLAAHNELDTALNQDPLGYPTRTLSSGQCVKIFFIKRAQTSMSTESCWKQAD